MATRKTKYQYSDRNLLPQDMEFELSKNAPEINNFAADYADNDDENVGSIIKAAAEVFDRYESEREPYEEVWKVLHYMFACAQNRSINTDERIKGANASSETRERAESGSTQFFRMVNQFAAQYMSVYLSRPSPFKYSPIINNNIFASSEEARTQSEHYDITARWVLKRNKDSVRTLDFATLAYLYGGYPEMVFMRQRSAVRTKREPVFIDEIEPSTGEPIRIPTQDFTETEEEFIVESFPEFQTFSIWNMYCDVNVGNMQDQEWVYLVDPITLSEAIEEARMGEYDIDKLRLLKRTHYWDGNIAGQHKEDERLSEGLDQATDPTDTGMILRWNIFANVPIDEDGNWDPAGTVPKRHWITILGNRPDDGIIVKVERNPDPDDEIPVNFTNVLPGPPDSFYHMAPGQSIRSNYSIECTLKNQIVDESTTDLNAPLIIRQNAFPSQTDFPWDGGVWECTGSPKDSWDRPSSGNSSQFALQLLAVVEDDTRRALAFDPSFLGQGLGSRASANEASGVRQSSLAPHLSMVRYIMAQREEWRARKIKSYMDNFAPTEQIIAITDDAGHFRPVEVGTLHGEFDIEINIVDEFEDSIAKKQAINEAMAIVAQDPDYKANTEIPELLKEFFQVLKLPAARLVTPPTDSDAISIARNENAMMINGGTVVRPQPGQNHKTHLVQHKAEELRWKGIPPESDPRVANAQTLLRAHIEETQLLSESETAQGAPLPRGQRNETEGEAQGNQIAAAQGG